MKNLVGKLAAMSLCLGVLTPLAAHDDTPLSEQMETVSDSLKQLRKAENFEAKAQLARDAQEAALKSLTFLPQSFEKETDKKKVAQMTADFKRLVGLTYSKLAELEIAFLAEDDAAADKVLDELKDIKKEGHSAYIDEEDE